MPTNTPNYNLALYNSTTDDTQTFEAFRLALAGTSGSSNMNLIDTQMKSTADAIATKFSNQGDETLGIDLLFDGDGTYDIGEVGDNRPVVVNAKNLVKTTAIEGTTFNKVTFTQPATGATLNLGTGVALSVPQTPSTSTYFETQTGTAVNDASTFGGYTLAQITQALFDSGLIL